jgi:hypothetical protein
LCSCVSLLKIESRRGHPELHGQACCGARVRHHPTRRRPALTAYTTLIDVCTACGALAGSRHALGNDDLQPPPIAPSSALPANARISASVRSGVCHAIRMGMYKPTQDACGGRRGGDLASKAPCGRGEGPSPTCRVTVSLWRSLCKQAVSLLPILCMCKA